MASAAPRLSPEIITVLMPRARRAASASLAPGLGSSPKASRARKAYAPPVPHCGSSLPPMGALVLWDGPAVPRPAVVRSAMADTVAPCACKAAASAARAEVSTPSSSIQRRLPITNWRPATSPSVPRPGTARTSSGAVMGNPLACAASTTARASGCSLPLCRLAAICSRASVSISAAATLVVAGVVETAFTTATRSAVNWGRPTVKVPVLSKATTSTLCASSSACASLIKMPCCAATPVPAMMATGVASPSAQGQAITSTATA